MEDQIRSEPDKTAEDRRKMMEMLKRLEEDTPADGVDDDDEDDDGDEEDSGEGEEGEGEEDGDERKISSLSKRMADVDLGELHLSSPRSPLLISLSNRYSILRPNMVPPIRNGAKSIHSRTE